MELKQTDSQLKPVFRIAFNRTSVELKPGLAGLIAQGNNTTFNRTSVELKHSVLCVHIASYASFNRTSVELKLCYVSLVSLRVFAFNRTSVELKLLILPLVLQISQSF